MKVCPRCKKEKELSQFWKNQAYCISCKGEQRALWRDKGGRKYHREYMRRTRQRVKEELIDILGSKCNGCGITDRRLLQLDHVENGGARHRRKHHGIGGLYYYKEMLISVKNGEKKYQLLCANCNYLKALEYHKEKMTIL